jgi:hypothetical protein
MTRTDIHKPSVINPADYAYVCEQNVKAEGLGGHFAMQAERAILRNHMERTGAKFSTHAHGGSCHICGAHAVWTSIFHHIPTNVYICTGHDCADKLGGSERGDEFRRNVGDALAARAGKRKAEALVAAEGIAEAWDWYERFENEVVTSIVSNVIRYGNISQKQVALVKKLINSDAGKTNTTRIFAERGLQVALDRKAMWQGDVADDRAWEELSGHERRENNAICDLFNTHEKWGKLSDGQWAVLERICGVNTAPSAAVPVSGDRLAIEGTVRTLKEQENCFGVVVKMLVEHVDGWKVWGTVPAAIEPDVEPGTVVRFIAKIKPSDTDVAFGFFSRPSKPEIVA